MHYWGDDWFKKNGRDLDQAINFIIRNLKTYGRIGSRGKEKFGCFRDHVTFWDGTIHGLIYPEYYYIKYPFLYFKFDRYITKPIVRFTGLGSLFFLYQKFVYNAVIQIACKKWPHLIDELVSDLEHYKLIKPGLFGNICGVTIHNKYWRKVDEKN